MIRMRRLLAALVAALATWLGVIYPAPAAAVPTPPLQAVFYDMPYYGQPTDHTAPERDPPTSRVAGGQSYDAVGPWPKGSFAPPQASAIYAHTTYDHAARLVKGDSARTMSTEQARGGDTAPFLVARRRVAAKSLPRSLDALSRQGAQFDRNGLTQAGRALQKHAYRAGNTAYPKVPGSQLNRAHQDVLDDILTHAQTAERSYVDSTFGPVREFLLPDVGARFEQFGRLIGFL